MITVENEEKMRELGERLGNILNGGEVIELVGDVGAGKTTFVRGLAKGLSIDETVQSPSFTISRVYDARDDLLLAHYDFYRITDPGIMADELAETLNQKKTVTVIEWSDTVKSTLPDDRLTIKITPSEEMTRNVELHPGGSISRKLTEKLT